MCELVLCLVLGNIAGLLDDLQQPPGQWAWIPPGTACIRSENGLNYRLTEISFHMLITRPNNLTFSAVLPEIHTFRKRYEELRNDAIYINTPLV